MNKMVKIGTLCLIVALGLVFVGCEDFTKAELGSVGKVSNVAYTGTTSLKITWDAASGGTSYSIVTQQVGKKTILQVNGATIGQVSGDSGIPDSDKWQATLTLSTAANGLAKDARFKLGVRATSIRNDKNPSIAWIGDEFTAP